MMFLNSLQLGREERPVGVVASYTTYLRIECTTEVGKMHNTRYTGCAVLLNQDPKCSFKSFTAPFTHRLAFSSHRAW